MRCLGLDLGTKTLGLAMSDKTNFIASPFKVLRWDGEDYELLFKELDSIIKDNNITDLVLGLPKNMNNTLGFAAERSLKFKDALENRYGMEVILTQKDGLKVVSTVKTVKPDVLLAEIFMPNLDILGVLVASGLCGSRNEARRAVEQGGVTVNEEKVTDLKLAFTPDELKEGIIVKRGKKNFRRVLM